MQRLSTSKSLQGTDILPASTRKRRTSLFCRLLHVGVTELHTFLSLTSPTNPPVAAHEPPLQPYPSGTIIGDVGRGKGKGRRRGRGKQEQEQGKGEGAGAKSLDWEEMMEMIEDTRRKRRG
eukprot:768646-Hanusia_phi.AAC.10